MVLNKFLTAAVASISLFCSSAFAFTPKKEYAKDKPTTEIAFDTNNTVFLRGEVSGASISKVVESLEKVKGQEVFLFIQSPGGSVIDGMTLVNYIKSSDKKIVCVADVAISMAFVILQACDERVSTLNSITMQHHMAFGAQYGEAPNVKSFVDFLLSLEASSNVEQAKRINIPLSDFEKKVDRDWWLFGEAIAKNNVTDLTAKTTCTRRAIEGGYSEFFDYMGLQIELVWSTCPSVLEPKAIKVSRPTQTNYGIANREVVGQEKEDVMSKVLARRFVEKRLKNKPENN